MSNSLNDDDSATDYLQYLKYKESLVQTRFNVDLNQKQLWKRMSLVKKLFELCEALHLKLSTVHTGVVILDVIINNGLFEAEYSSHETVIGCVSLAAKLEEHQFNNLNLLEIKKYYNLSDLNFLAELEMKILEKAEFDILVSTAATFFELFMAVAVDNDDIQEINLSKTDVERLIRKRAETIMNTAVKAFYTSEFLPSHVAASSILTARELLQLEWTETLKKFTGFTCNDLWPCFSIMMEFSRPVEINRNRKRKSEEIIARDNRKQKILSS